MCCLKRVQLKISFSLCSFHELIVKSVGGVPLLLFLTGYAAQGLKTCTPFFTSENAWFDESKIFFFKYTTNGYNFFSKKKKKMLLPLIVIKFYSPWIEYLLFHTVIIPDTCISCNQCFTCGSQQNDAMTSIYHHVYPRTKNLQTQSLFCFNWECHTFFPSFTIFIFFWDKMQKSLIFIYVISVRAEDGRDVYAIPLHWQTFLVPMHVHSARSVVVTAN